MTRLVPLTTCLQQALAGLLPVAAARGELALGGILAEDLCFPADCPPTPVALRAGVSMASLDSLGASAHLPLPMSGGLRVLPGDALPSGHDAVLPPDAVTQTPEALREAQPGEGIRRAGHDGRCGDIIARASDRLGARAVLVARLAGVGTISQRRPKVQLALQCPELARFVRLWALAQGADIVETAANLVLRTAPAHLPRLALSPGECGWIARDGDALVIDLPPRFDAALAVLLALCLPALAALSGRELHPSPLTLARKVTSTIGMTDLVLLRPDAGGWHPFAPGVITLSALAQARAFALVPPDVEGFAAGATVLANPLDPDQDCP